MTISDIEEQEIEEHEIFKQALLYPYTGIIPTGYKLIKSLHNKTGLDAYVFKKDDNIIIAYEGTNTHSAKDLINDNQISKGKVSKQCQEGRKLCQEIKETYPVARIINCGYSLGGGISGYTAALEHTEAVNFSPWGARELLMKTNEPFDVTRIVNYCNIRDGISSKNADKQIGFCYAIETKSDVNLRQIVPHHLLHNQGDLRNRKFVTKQELKEMYYETKEKDKNVKKKHNNHISSSGCVGSYPVSGYTRDDGTKVSGYVRTCGAAHNSKKLENMTEAEIDELLDRMV